MDITGIYSFYLNKINVASNFVKQYKDLHIMYSRPLVIKYKAQIKSILEIFKERNDVKKQEIEAVEKILVELHRVEDELYLKEKEELRKLYAAEANKKASASATHTNKIENINKKVEDYLTRSPSVHSSDDSINQSSYTEDRYDRLVQASNDIISEAITSAYKNQL
ncbi:unnamed protein product [Chironomus riparius]|uniref:Uncharacterized protein n=1 Tax=Chironomus riparius TaxID=315576 RepID=A0A9N9WLA1_9DIPT|nr:unnamed protein product [Chironomus riparius]